ncbi:hypothetical protein [Stenotrophomonas sp. YIM B06876]|uniref:hypothetical protein n=1 Tax=Stenotrophomonas sp. YIM B06876 TaxID=3060211 RepID=UPI00273A214A|nr:hypothetical protein [Stenotrophomonas sp. YIM B06876]
MSSLACHRCGIALLLGGFVLLSAGCASTGKQPAAAAATAAEVPLKAASGGERDALGNYRFMMQQDGQKMGADQFDAWMKAHGIRVAKGAAAPTAAPAKKYQEPRT